jgi:flagellar biosynthesis protein FlhA
MIERILEQNPWARNLFRSDVAVALGLVMILLVMIIPLPAFLLDIFLAMNITLALLIMVISLYTVRALDFAIFPALLLGTTLFRLSLNVASTRLILLHGNEGPSAAGAVIQSFGQFVIGGNYVVGLVVFVILVVINFMVITKGAGRVAEVAARFTLDAMPGKQMAIDADLNAGLISETEARTRRTEVAEEANFHGAMDGASKFVKGDAIAGIIITLINIGAGFVIGVLQKGMTAGAAAQNYTILTVGDGLVGQIPALIISTSAGILVTRTGGGQDLGTELKSQFTFHPRALWVVSAILLGFALIPGLPHLSFLVLAAATSTLAWRVQKTRALRQAAEAREVPEPAAPKEDDYESMLTVDLLELEVGYGLIPMVDASQNGELLARIRSIRKQYAMEMGFIVPPIHIKDNLQLKPNEYALLLKGIRVGGGEMLPGHVLAMNPGIATEQLKGVATTEPAFGLPATWIPEEKKEHAEMAGYTVVDGGTVITTHISEIIKRHAYELIGRQEVQNLLDNIGKSYPKLVEELTPNALSLGVIMRVLQNLLREQVSIRDLRTVLETLADWAPASQDAELLTEYVRQALSRAICGQYAEDGQTLELLTLDPTLEQKLRESAQHSSEGSFLALDPGTASAFLENLSRHIKELQSAAPLLLCPPTIRPHVKRLTERYLPNLVVLSHNEIAPHLQVRSAGTVSLNAG